MLRTSLLFLQQWLVEKNRKPLVIRGARQVGKTWLVRHLAALKDKALIEINLEKQPNLASLLTSNDPREIVLKLSDLLDVSIDPKKTILFFDEIQAMPELLAKLRWFAEDMPELPVIAAGSLLEFVLADHTFSMPVGRISYMHLEPLSFEEFLEAHERTGLLRFIRSYQWKTDIPEAMHEELMLLFKEYIIVGGMPAAVDSWIQNRSLQEVDRKHLDLLATYRDDFSKYSKRIPTERIDAVMMAVPRLLGAKFVYSKIDSAGSSKQIKQALELLCKARICHRVAGTAANGVPLGAQIQEGYRKIIFLDVGLCSTILGLSLNELHEVKELDLVNKGGIAEQVVGQLLRTIEPVYKEPALYYWQRLEKGSDAEIDYIIQYGSTLIPIEVKAGKTGTLKSLHLFMSLKEKSLALRINSNFPQITEIKIRTSESEVITPYKLLSLPFYLLGQIHRLMKS